MILPNKYLREDETLFGFGLIILKHLQVDRSLSDLWDDVKKIEGIGNYEYFILTLDMLYLFGLIEYKKNMIKRTFLC